MKKHVNYLMTALMVIPLLFCGCHEEPTEKPIEEEPIEEPIAISNVIEAKDVRNSNSEIATVKAMRLSSLFDESDTIIIATGNYANDAFILELPETLADTLLKGGIGAGFPASIVVSDYNAKSTQILLVAYDNTEQETGVFNWYGGISTTRADAMYIYSDRKFTIKGKYTSSDNTYTLEYDCSYEKGWNIVYKIAVTSNEKLVSTLVTTKKPTEYEIFWHFEKEAVWKKKKNIFTCIKTNSL
jgi:hypothetical protein